jgi:hypothetical protein
LGESSPPLSRPATSLDEKPVDVAQASVVVLRAAAVRFAVVFLAALVLTGFVARPSGTAEHQRLHAHAR